MVILSLSLLSSLWAKAGEGFTEKRCDNDTAAKTIEIKTNSDVNLAKCFLIAAIVLFIGLNVKR